MLNSLINLVADILKRNNLGKAELGKTITYHSMYTATTCPGNYLKSKMNYIVNKVNEKLGYGTISPSKPDNSGGYIINSAVLEWQKTINKVYNENLALDSILFEPDCKSKTLALQKKYNLKQDGCIGLEVIKVLLT